MTTELWRIELLGELRASRGSQVFTRFYTHKIGGLLAYLALYNRMHPREELITLFWPDVDIDQGRISLRTALASLRRQLEPQDAVAGSVLTADRSHVYLQPNLVAVDVADFERDIKEAGRDDVTEARQTSLLTHALSLYQSDLLPGYYDEWVLIERERLSELRLRALRRIYQALERQGDYMQAIEYARQITQVNPLDEAAHSDLIRSHAALGQASAAQRQYQEMERVLRKELGVAPAQSFHELIQSARNLSAATASSSIIPHETAAVPPASPPSEPAPPLPTAFTTFFGREEEIAQVSASLKQSGVRLVTLTGLGGLGKTRLALEAARSLQQNTERAVYFVSLVDITDARQIGETICKTLRIEISGRNDPLDLAAKAFRHRSAVLILDNFEQLVEDGVPVVQRLLEACPDLTCLITSRVRLGLTGEWELPVLPLPTPAAPATPQHLMEFACVALFVSRSQAVRPDFRLTPANAQAVAQLCHALDGAPLALELAAARSSVLTPAQMLQQMTRRFDFLVARQRDAAERHRTLRATLEWSYGALEERRQRMLSRLSVFRGGWTIEAVEAVCEEPAALDLLMDLRDASLVLAEEQEGEMRFRMLETVREYAAERLVESGQEVETQQRHLRYFLGVAEEHDWASTGQAYILWRERVEADYENIRAAVLCSLRRKPFASQEIEAETPSGAALLSPAEAALRLTGSLGAYWILSSHYREGLVWLRQAISFARETVEPASDAAWALALMSAGYVAFVANDFEAARRDATTGLTFARKADDLIQQIQCLAILAQLPADARDPDRALRLLEEAHAIAIETGNPRKIAFVLYVLGRISYLRGEEERARQALEQSLSLSRSTKDGNMIAHAAANLASLALWRGHVCLARALSAEALKTYNAGGFRGTQGFNGIVANVEAFIAIQEGNHSHARAMLLQRLRASLEIGDKGVIPSILLGLAVVACGEDDPETAAELLSITERRYQQLGFQPEPMEQSFRERALTQIRAQLTEAQFQAAWANGLRLEPDDVCREIRG